MSSHLTRRDVLGAGLATDGSSFTTGAGVNPTSTIGALAVRAADGIWERRSGWN